jgi:hypothetical protein
MTVLFSDDFNRADGAPGSNWAQTGGGTDFTIVSNELTCSVSGNRSLAIASGALSDQTNYKVTWKRASGSGYDAGVFLRGSLGGTTSNTGNAYIINPFSSQIDIIRRVAGVNSTVGSRTGLTLADGDTYAVEITGTGTTVSFQLYQNGSALGAAITDTNAARIVVAGATGIYVFQSGSMNDDVQVEDIASGDTTLTPSVGQLVWVGQIPSTNPFTNVRIRDVLINEAGSPVGSRTGIHLMVWYGGVPSGAPDLSLSNMTSDANGTISWSLVTGSLVYNQNVFYIAHDGNASGSLSQYTCARVIPSYE